MYMYIPVKVIDQGSSGQSSYQFPGPEPATDQFSTVVANIAKELNDCIKYNTQKIDRIHRQLTTGKNKVIFSESEASKIQSCRSIFGLFNVMHPYWNWSSHRLLFTIIKIVESSQAESMLSEFESKINYQMKLKDVHEHLRKFKVPAPTGCSKMIAIVNKDYSTITLKEGLQIEELVLKHLGQAQPSDCCGSQSLLRMMWYVPDIAVDSLCSKAFQHKKDLIAKSFLLLQIGNTLIIDENKQSMSEVN